MLGILKLDNHIQRYAWGSTTTLARLLGRPPAAEPEAELWMGAHPQAPSVVRVAGRRVTLDRLLAERPREALGAAADRFGPTLPFLLKLLAVARPLSIQAHPTRAQAAAGYAREEAAGIPRDAPQRNYRDRNHKPEVVVALEPYWLLSGFRPYREIVDRLRALGAPVLDGAVAELAGRPGPAALRGLLATLLGLEEAQRAELVAQAVAAAERVVGATAAPMASGRGVPGAAEGTAGAAATSVADEEGAADPAGAGAVAVAVAATEAFWVRRLAAEYPTDVGVLAPYLLNLVHLAPGEGLYTGAGTLHTSLQGSGVELQASSDNVLRCGLTAKHIDVPELLRIGRFEPRPAAVVTARPSPGERHYPTPAAEFALSELDLRRGAAAVTTDGSPEILLLLDGPGVLLDPGGREIRCRPGESLFVPACVSGWRAHGGGRLFRARVLAYSLSITHLTNFI